MGSLILIILIFLLGFWIGRKTAPKTQKQDLNKQTNAYSFTDRQRLKVAYASDADRIREMNTLTHKEGAFFTALKREFPQCEVVIKNKRFFIVDKDGFPIAIFEFRDGTKPLRADDIEDGLPVFLYKGIMPAGEAIKEDKQRIAEMSRR